MASGDVVRICNVGDTDFKDSFNGRRYLVPAQGQLMVDFDAMCLWLGHPEANNFDPRNRVRVQEFDRLRVRYGVDAKALEMSIDHIPFDEGELFHAMKPALEAYDMANDRILTVADDPDGDFQTLPNPETATDTALLMARLQQNEQETANLRHQLAQMQRKEQAMDEAQPIGTDTSPAPAPPPDIPGTVPTTPAKAPTPPSRTTTGEDTPTRIRVTQS